MTRSIPTFVQLMEPLSLNKAILSGVTLEEIESLLLENSSLRGYVQGFVAERRLAQILRELPDVEKVEKIPDASDEKGDLRITYKGEIIRLELKSLSSDSIRHDCLNETWQGRVRSKATDKRDVEIEGVGVVRTSCLIKGEFDILGICCLPVDGTWSYLFMEEIYLPETSPHLIQTSFVLNPAITPGVQSNPLVVFDSVLAKRRAKIGERVFF
jgi:hypothetical protein